MLLAAPMTRARVWLRLLAFVGMGGVAALWPGSSQACSCGLPFARLLSPVPGARHAAVLPLLVYTPSDSAFVLEDSRGAAVPWFTTLVIPQLGLCSSPTYLVTPRDPLVPGTTYRLRPIFTNPPGTDPIDRTSIFDVTNSPPRLISTHVEITVSFSEHDPLVPVGSLCADNTIAGRPFSRTAKVAVASQPPVDLIVTGSVEDPVNGRVVDSRAYPVVAWTSPPPNDPNLQTFSQTLSLPLYDGVEACVGVEIWDLSGALLLTDRLCPTADVPDIRVLDVAVVGADQGAPAPGGCSVAGAPVANPALLGISLMGLLGLARSRRSARLR